MVTGVISVFVLFKVIAFKVIGIPSKFDRNQDHTLIDATGSYLGSVKSQCLSTSTLQSGN